MSIGSRFFITMSESDCQYDNESTHSQFTKTNCNKHTTNSSLTVRQGQEHMMNSNRGMNPNQRTNQSSKQTGIAIDKTDHIG